MSERLLRRGEIAARLGTTSGVAASILAKYGCYPIDLGCGRGRGPRWLESAVNAALYRIHIEAQPEERKAGNKPVKRPKSGHDKPLAECTASEVYNRVTIKALPDGPCLQ